MLTPMVLLHLIPRLHLSCILLIPRLKISRNDMAVEASRLQHLRHQWTAQEQVGFNTFLQNKGSLVERKTPGQRTLDGATRPATFTKRNRVCFSDRASLFHRSAIAAWLKFYWKPNRISSTTTLKCKRVSSLVDILVHSSFISFQMGFGLGIR